MAEVRAWGYGSGQFVRLAMMEPTDDGRYRLAGPAAVICCTDSD